MAYTKADYRRERALCDADRKWSEQFIKPNGWTVIPADAKRPRRIAKVDNAMRGRVEQYELLNNPPDAFTAYLSSDKRSVTVWTGDVLGRAEVRSIGQRRGYTGERQHYGRAWIGGREYSWQGPGACMYCRLRALKA